MKNKKKRIAIAAAIAIAILGLFSLAFRDPEMSHDDRIFIIHK
jgi:hypothetical protein